MRKNFLEQREKIIFLSLALFILVLLSLPSLVLGYCCPAWYDSLSTYHCVSECNGMVGGGACFVGGNANYSDVGYLCKDSDRSKCFMANLNNPTSWTRDGRFPDTNQYNGNVCAIYENGNIFSLTCGKNGEGVWDASDPDGPKCIKCTPNEATEDKVCGTANKKISGDSYLSKGCTVEGNKKCEFACDQRQDPKNEICDEVDKVPSPGVSVTGGACINCIFFAQTNCGNGRINAGEECDPLGPILNGETCQSRGFTGGQLACYPLGSPLACTFDTSGCTSNGSSGTCPCLGDAAYCSSEAFKGGLVPCGRICDNPDTPDVNECCPCTFCHIFVLLDNIVDFLLLKVVPALAILILVIGGVLFVTATGNPGLMSHARSIFKATVIALLIIYGAWLIVSTILAFMGVLDWVWPPTWSEGWYDITCPVL